MRRPGWAARLAALVLAAVLAGGAAEGAEPFRTAHRAAALSFTAEGPDIVWETEPGGSAYLITGPEAVPMTEVFLLAAPKNDGKA